MAFNAVWHPGAEFEDLYVRTQGYDTVPGSVGIHTNIKLSDDPASHAETPSPASHYFPEGEFIPPGFFDNVNRDIFTLPTELIDWKYDMRRDFQKILPFLYLGPWSCLRDREKLRSEGITLLLAVRDKRLAHARLASGDKAAAEVGIEAESVDVAGYQELITVLPQTIRRINEHISTPGFAKAGDITPRKVLVFCETGNGLSASVIYAYLMAMFNMDLSSALQLVHLQRFCIETEVLARQHMGAFEEILEAKRDVGKAGRSDFASSNLQPSSTVTKKRSFFERGDGAGAGGDGMDIEGDYVSRGREGDAPFKDRES